MIKVYNCEYEYGMKRVAFYKELGHEIELDYREKCIHFFFSEMDATTLQLTNRVPP